MFQKSELKEALATLGEILQDRHQAADLLVIGGGALLLTNFIQRPTKDLDVVARYSDGALVRAEPFWLNFWPRSVMWRAPYRCLRIG